MSYCIQMDERHTEELHWGGGVSMSKTSHIQSVHITHQRTLTRSQVFRDISTQYSNQSLQDK